MVVAAWELFLNPEEKKTSVSHHGVVKEDTSSYIGPLLPDGHSAFTSHMEVIFNRTVRGEDFDHFREPLWDLVASSNSVEMEH